MGRERLTARHDGMLLFRKDGQLTPYMNMSHQDIRQVMKHLAIYEDAMEQGKMAPVVRCKDCYFFKRIRGSEQGFCKLHSETPDQYSTGFDFRVGQNDFCSMGEYEGGVSNGEPSV